jgi:hypothetical protein
LKENLQTILAGIGCTPLLAIGLFIIGAGIGQFVTIDIMPPPTWLLLPTALFPLCFGLYLRAYVTRKDTPHWLELWRKSGRRKVVGHAVKPSMEEFWVENQIQQSRNTNIVRRILDDPLVWAWATFLCFLALAYICLWFGFMADGA